MKGIALIEVIYLCSMKNTFAAARLHDIDYFDISKKLNIEHRTHINTYVMYVHTYKKQVNCFKGSKKCSHYRIIAVIHL